MDVTGTCDLGREFVYQDVSLGGTSDAITDLSIPSGKVVVGSGHQVVGVYSSGSMVAPETLTQSAAAGAMAYVTVSNGPHPTD